jgi:N-acetylglucosaminyl-diphospho-decaprenol L-rhamnosyltransferase
MHVAVAIVGFRNAGDIEQCLKALEKSVYADFEVVICENGGPEAFAALEHLTPKVLAGGQPVKLVLAPDNLGFAGGVNTCLRSAANADAWWVLNPDTEPSEGSLGALVARLATGDCDAVGGVLYRPNGRIQSYGGRWRGWLARAESIGNGQSKQDSIAPDLVEREQNYLNGASMLIGRRFLDVVGPMREDYFLYAEEVEWFLRGEKRGMKLGFAPGADILHRQGTTTGAGEDHLERPRMPVYLGERNKLLVTWDCYPYRAPVAAMSALVLIFLRYGRRGAWRQLGFGVSGWAAGLFNQRGRPSWA